MTTTQLPDDWLTAIEQFITWQRAGQATPATLKQRRYQLTRFAQAHAELGPHGVTLDDLTEWLDPQRSGWAPESRKSQRAALRTFFNWLHITEQRADNPARMLRPIRVPAPRWRGVPEHAVAELAAHDDARLSRLGRMAATLGMRAGELAVSHRSDLYRDFVGWSLYIHGKGGKTRTVPVPDELGDELQHATGYFFPGRTIDGHLSPGHVTKLLSKALGNAGTAHGLRHRAAGQFYIGTGHDLRTVQELLGHASIRTTQRYVPADQKQMRLAVNAAAATASRDRP